jgi:hypothetical protein
MTRLSLSQSLTGRPLRQPELRTECHPVDLASARPRGVVWAAFDSTAADIARLCPRGAVW